MKMSGPAPAIVGLADPGQMRSFTWNYASTRRRAFNSSVASFFVLLVNRCACGHPHSSILRREWVRVWKTRRKY